MRIALIAAVAVFQLVIAAAPALACPNGYSHCGARYCCPR